MGQAMLIEKVNIGHCNTEASAYDGVLWSSGDLFWMERLIWNFLLGLAKKVASKSQHKDDTTVEPLWSFKAVDKKVV